jgi:hypothetical protein
MKTQFLLVLSYFLLWTTADAAAQVPSHDTVVVTPQKPVNTDSLHFNLFNLNHNCCTKYDSLSVSVVDTVITLLYQYQDSNCNCLVAGSYVQLACGPQKAGKYAIYKEESRYCPVPPCPGAPIVIERVGQVTVTVPTGSVLNDATSPIYHKQSFGGIVCTLDGRKIGEWGRCGTLPHGVYLVQQGTDIRKIVR